MLQFYYDFLNKYLDRADFQMCEMDADSAYIAIAGDSVQFLVKAELHKEFQQDKCKCFAYTDTPDMYTRLMISELQVFLRLSGSCNRLSVCAQKRFTVLERKTSFLVKG